MAIITLYKGSIGLNTKLDPKNIKSNAEESLIELSQAYNVSIDDRGLVSLRNGNTQQVSGSFHSLFCDGGDCFVVMERVSDAAIYRVMSDLTLSTTPVKEGLTKNRRMVWAQVNTDTFYSNGAQNGYIRSGVAYTWRLGTYKGPDADMQFAAAVPIANHMAFRQMGQCVLGVGSVAYLNHQPFQYGLFNLRKGAIGFESNLTMLADVQGGFYASDAKRTWFFRNTGTWYGYRQEAVDSVPVIEGSLAHNRILLRDAEIDANGFGRIWCSTKGVCVGTDDGTVINLTKEKVEYPTTYNYAACLIKDSVVINTIY